jgi:hypothetical protein
MMLGRRGYSIMASEAQVRLPPGSGTEYQNLLIITVLTVGHGDPV